MENDQDDYDDEEEYEIDDNEYDIARSSADSWEDVPAAKAILAKLPPGWSLMKVVGYTVHKLADINVWCHENCRGRYRKEGWYGGCAYTVCVAFEDPYDALAYRLRWQ